MKTTSLPPCERGIARCGEVSPPLAEEAAVLAVADRFDTKTPPRRRAAAGTWHFAKLALPGTYQQWADALWYLGHVMAVGSLVSRYSLPAAAVMVGVGQLMVIISRPLGRLPAAAAGPAPLPPAADDSV